MAIVAGCLGLFAGPCFAHPPPAAAAANLVVNGDFEKGTVGWDALWTRDSRTGQAALDTGGRHGGTQAIRIEQQTRFASGVVVTVNFGDAPYSLSEGTVRPPSRERVDGIKPD